MCFTIDQIERACGLLLLDEFNGFVYYCKKCSCDFDSGPNLEVHILSEHQDDKETVFVIDDVFVDNVKPTITETEPTVVKDEQFEENFEQLSESIVKGSKEQNANALTAPIESKSSDEYNTPLAALFESHEINNDSSSDELTKVKSDVSLVKKRSGRPFGWRKRKNSDSDESFTPGKRSNNKPPKSKKRKVDDLSVTRPVGRPFGSKNKNYPEGDIQTTYAMDDEEENPIKRIGHPTIGILYCDMCPDLTFNGKMNLTKHMHHCHIKQKKKCEICNKITRNGYESHMKKFHTIQHKCNLCDVVFKHPINLEVHMRKHRGERPFLCAQCGKSFTSQGLYRKHETTMHSGVRKFKCQHCDRSYHRNYRLRDHVNAFHTKERPHVCSLCGKGFTSSSYLRIHKMTHGEASLPCRYCERKFKLAENRNKHEVSIHKIMKTGSGSYQQSWSMAKTKNVQIEDAQIDKEA